MPEVLLSTKIPVQIYVSLLIFYFYWSQCESAPAIQILRKSWKQICRLKSSCSNLMPTRGSHNHVGNITDIKATGERRGRHFHLFAGKSRETVAPANGLALRVHLITGAHDNTLNRYGKGYWGSGKDGDYPRSHKDRSPVFASTGKVRSHWGQLVGQDIPWTWICLFLNYCCLSWLLPLVHWAPVNLEHLVQEAQMGVHLAPAETSESPVSISSSPPTASHFWNFWRLTGWVDASFGDICSLKRECISLGT